jgi:hypothetical protein
MAEYFFAKLPQTQYANSVCVDLTKKVVLANKLRTSPMVYDDYELQNSSRADIIAENYYDDPTMEWMVWLVNGVVDPYYGWNLSNEQFNAHLTKKYGSVDTTLEKIAYYRNNWRNDDSELSPSFYNSQLLDNLKKYYSPNYNEGITILSYSRKQDDTITNTNKMYNFDITLSNTQVNFVVGEIVDITPNTAPFTVIGGGEVVFANTTTVKIKNISGNTSATNLVKGETSNATATIAASTLLFENITDDEAVYWEPVYLYDVENDKNEQYRRIKLMNPAYAKEAAYNMRTIFKK